MPNNMVASFSRRNGAPAGYLIAGIALQAPNRDPRAIPIPESIAFLYSLPRRRINELGPRDSACPICLDEFTTDGLGPEVDHFKNEPEIPLVLLCNHILGNHCAWRLFTPFGEVHANSCPICRQEFFAKQTLSDTPVGMDRMLRLVDWSIQECRRRLVEGPQEGKQDARDRLAKLGPQRRSILQFKAEMETGRGEESMWDRMPRAEIVEELRRMEDRMAVMEAALEYNLQRRRRQ